MTTQGGQVLKHSWGDGKKGRVLIVGIDSIKQKNLMQLSGLTKLGYRFLVITTDAIGNSRQVSYNLDNVEVRTTSRRWPRFSFLYELIRALVLFRPEITEIYPYSALGLISALLCRLLLVKVLLIARGEEYYYLNGKMSPGRAWFFRTTFNFGHAALYKELYFQHFAKQFPALRSVHIPNSVSRSSFSQEHRDRECVFLYLNSFKFFRHPELAAEAFAKLVQNLCAGTNKTSPRVSLLIVGAQPSVAGAEYREKQEMLNKVLVRNGGLIEVYPWTTDPEPWYRRAHVFLLPADLVYPNIAILEAMARGLVPIVQEAEGAELLVSHDESGYIVPKQVDKWVEYMKDLALNAEKRAQLGRFAKERAANLFSEESYLREYLNLYEQLRRQNYRVTY